MKFSDLLIGDTFDFINEENPMHNSFFLRCKKISKKCYSYEGVKSNKIGSKNAICYHVKGRNH